MRLDILHMPGCPGAALLRARLARVLPDYPDVRVSWKVVTTEEEATRAGMPGSPTILADGADAFASPSGGPALSCRLYRDEVGSLGPAPSARQLRGMLDGLGARGS